MDNDTRVTVEWYTVEVTTYRRAFDISDLKLEDGEDAASVLAAISRGETPYIDTATLVDYETTEYRRHWDCDERSIEKVTIDELEQPCSYPNCHAPHAVIVDDRKLCAEHGAGYTEYRNVTER